MGENMEEKRKYPRKKLNFYSLVNCEGKSFSMRVDNISRSGICLFSGTFGELNTDIGNGSGSACGKMLDVIINDFDLSMTTMIVRVDKSKGEYGCAINDASDPDILRAICV